jgi:hypothetical protein
VSLATSERRARFGSRMQATKSLEIRVVERLNADRNPIDPGVAKFPEPSGLDRGGVGFQRDFEIVGTGPARTRGINDVGHDARFHERRRSPAKKDTAQDAWTGFMRNTFYFKQIGIQPPLVVHPGRDVGVEVAIGALRLAERPVDVESEVSRVSRLRRDQRFSPVWRRHPRGG